jgi:hypothetical protein
LINAPGVWFTARAPLFFRWVAGALDDCEYLGEDPALGGLMPLLTRAYRVLGFGTAAVVGHHQTRQSLSNVQVVRAIHHAAFCSTPFRLYDQRYLLSK